MKNKQEPPGGRLFYGISVKLLFVGPFDHTSQGAAAPTFGIPYLRGKLEFDFLVI